MFLNLCWLLNVVGLSSVAAWMRRVIHRTLIAYLPTEYVAYSNSERIGYLGYVEMKHFGVLCYHSAEPVGVASDGSPLFNLYQW